jgi:hypothetical protein
MTTTWLTLSIVGLITTAWVLTDALKDRQELIRSGRNGVLKRVANAQVRSAAMKTCKLTIMTAVGVIATVAEPGAPVRGLIVVGLIAIAALITASALMQRRDRRKIKPMLDR